MPDLDQPVGEYPEMNAAAYLQTDAHIARLLDIALASLRAANRKAEELRRENVRLTAKLDAALVDKDRWYMAAMNGRVTP
jgi:hypothetical protein